jgi:hypothetical protein
VVPAGLKRYGGFVRVQEHSLLELGGRIDNILMIRLIAGLMAVSFVVLYIAGMWRVFSKAGQPGWAVLVPFYNNYILLKIGGMPGWWLLLLLIPLVNIVILAIEANHVAKSFGKSGSFGFFLLFLFPIGYMILGFGNSRYLGPAAYRPAMEAGSYASGQGQPRYGQRQIPDAQGALAAQSSGAAQAQPSPTQVRYFFCSKCGAQLTTGASFCGSCGSAA